MWIHPWRLLVYWLCTPLRAVRTYWRVRWQHVCGWYSDGRDELTYQLHDQIARRSATQIARDQKAERDDARLRLSTRCNAILQALHSTTTDFGLQLTDNDDIRAAEWGKANGYQFVAGHIGGAYVVRLKIMGEGERPYSQQKWVL